MRNPHMGNLDTLEADPVAPTGTSAFEKVVNSIQALTGAASNINNTWTGKVVPPVQKPSTDWSKILLYGGIGLLGVVLVMKISKGRRR
jgi:hypothetical protein